MPAARTAKKSAKPAAKASAKAAAKAPAKRDASVAAKAPAKSAAKSSAKAGARMSLAEAMDALRAAGSEQTRKTYARHGAKEPMFGVSFATLKLLVKRIGVDHDLALQLWKTGNYDARVLAAKIADPARMKSSELDQWTRDSTVRLCGNYVSMLAAEGPLGAVKVREWLASSETMMREAGYLLASHLAKLDESTPDDWYADLLKRIEQTIHTMPNDERAAMNGAVIAIGGRSEALRKAATAAAKRISKVEVDHGDTACKTPDAGPYIEKAWTHARSKKFASPAAQERAREPMRLRC